MIYFEHEEQDKWVKELQSKGIKFVQEPAEQSYLWREAILNDPSNNKIKLYWAGVFCRKAVKSKPHVEVMNIPILKRHT